MLKSLSEGKQERKLSDIKIFSQMLTYPYNFCKDLAKLKRQAAIIGWNQALREVIRPDSSASWQFTKYLIIGFTAVLIFYATYGMFRLLVEIILPGSFTNQRLSWNLLSIFLAFLPTNLFTYHTNRRWVFLDGKYSQRKEFILFTTGAAISFFICQFVVFGLIHYTIVNDFVVTFSVILVSTGINFLFRKFFVFHG